MHTVCVYSAMTSYPEHAGRWYDGACFSNLIDGSTERDVGEYSEEELGPITSTEHVVILTLLHYQSLVNIQMIHNDFQHVL